MDKRELVLSFNPPLIDLHQDISLYYVLGGYGLKFKPESFEVDLQGRHGDIPKFKRANVRVVFSSIAHIIPTQNQFRLRQQVSGYGVKVGAMRIRSPTMITLEHIKTYYNLLTTHRDDLALLGDPSDLQQVEKKGKTWFLIAIEGAEPLEDIEDLDLFYMLGVRSLQITWNFDNKYAATCMSKRDYGLTGDGEELIERCNELGVIIDLAHASKKSTIEALELSRLPAIVSHANASSVHRHVRNLDDDELDALRKNGGVVGVTMIEPTLGGAADVKRVADHIMYIFENFGKNLVAIGTDFFGIMHVDEPKGLEDVTKFGNLWSELLSRGLTREDIELIAYRNALRVIMANSVRWEPRIF
ncbi:MAG: membrane dipeptidase [Nitrososphaerota archaeon]